MTEFDRLREDTLVVFEAVRAIIDPESTRAQILGRGAAPARWPTASVT